MRKDTHSICIVIMVFLSAALIVMLVFESLHLSPRLSIGLEDLRAVTNGIILILAGLLWLTNLKRAEAISNEKRFENIVQSVGPDVLMVVDPKRRIVMCNESVEKMFGYEKEEIIGKKTDVLYGDRRANAKREQEIFKALDETGFHRGVAKGKTKGGKKVDLEIVTGKLRGSEGAVVLLRDITERKRLEGTIKRLNEDLDRRVVERTAELEKACTTLKQIDRVKDTFLSSVSHEFRTPLTSIRSFSEILLHYDDLEQEQSREFISIINLESERLSRMVNDVLDLAKIDAGKMEWNFKECRIDKVITSAVKGIHGLLLENDITLDMNVQSELRECIIDEDKIHQVVTNLLSNAIKFTPENGQIGLDVHGDAEQQIVHFTVWDTGIGIP
ncbi:MAG: histidine kinase dimerization/phospho-acceptor domain-containing protein, partial [bacterium]